MNTAQNYILFKENFVEGVVTPVVYNWHTENAQ